MAFTTTVSHARNAAISMVACIFCGCVAFLSLIPSTTNAQGFGGGGFGGQAVGGISIDAQGIVGNLDPHAREELSRARKELLKGTPAEGFAASKLRKISLSGLVTAVQKATLQGEPLSADVLFLSGLTGIRYLFLDSENKDIVLVGPAEAIAVNPLGDMVGATSGKPLLQLEDLIVSLRAIDGARNGGMRCSIDPSADGIKRLNTFLRKQKTIGPSPDATLRAIETTLGPQTVSVGGVPENSHFARVLVAADYRMKRIAMGFEPSGVKGLPSYLSMVPPGGSGVGGMMPRFWLEARYEPIGRDADELAWEITGRHVECLTENDMIDSQGKRKGRAEANSIAKKWCLSMTTHYEELAQREAIFGELLNCIDLAVVAAVVRGRELDRQVGLDLGPLLDEQKLLMPVYDAPSTVPTIASAIKKSNQWVISASGGVQFQPWEFATNSQKNDDVAKGMSAALASRTDRSWWWD